MNRGDAEESLNELELLADTAGAKVLDKVIQERKAPNPTYFIGKGKAELLANSAKELEADLVIFDDDLSPAQMSNLEKLMDRKIVDRSGLILDIFAKRARTKEAKLQVELAQLEYLAPKLTRQWTHLSRQAGGIGTSGPGIGARGPGETQLEIDRRKVRKRIYDLSRALKKVEKSREVSRKNRSDVFQVCLVGYTNAGKSTLMRALSGEDVFVEDRLFATLDSITRIVQLKKASANTSDGGGQGSSKARSVKILLTDTVGFIKKLPHNLIASFRGTLEEVVQADLLIHVVDVSHPACEEQIGAVNEVLSELGVANTPTVMALNKIDLLREGGTTASSGLLERFLKTYPEALPISSVNGDGLDELKDALRQRVERDNVVLDLELDYTQGKLLGELYSIGEILKRKDEDGHVALKVRLKRDDGKRIKGKIERVDSKQQTGPDPHPPR